MKRLLLLLAVLGIISFALATPSEASTKVTLATSSGYGDSNYTEHYSPSLNTIKPWYVHWSVSCSGTGYYAFNLQAFVPSYSTFSPAGAVNKVINSGSGTITINYGGSGSYFVWNDYSSKCHVSVSAYEYISGSTLAN